MEIKNIFSKLSPKILLDSYWEIFSMLSWKSTLIFKDENKFTIPQLKNAISQEVNKYNNPFTRRKYQRSLNAVDQVVEMLLKAGILSDENGVLFKSSTFNKIYYLLKRKIKNNTTRVVAWAIWYLYHNGIESFSTNELLKHVSYEDSECTKELPYLHIWKKDKFHKLLEKSRSKDAWLFKELPHSFNKPILLQDLHERLLSALSKIYKFKKEFNEKELITALRSLELKSAERAIKKLKLRAKDGKWHVDKSDIRRIEDFLFGPLPVYPQWPLFGIIPTSNPYFKIEGEFHNAYVDMPNRLIEEFLNELSLLSSKYGNDPETLYKEATKIKEKFNKEFEKIGNWYKIILRREKYGKRPFGVRAKINWTIFQQFIESFAYGDIPLENKYRYLSWCRSGVAWTKRKPGKKLCEEIVKEIVKEDVNSITTEIDNLTDKLYKVREKHRNKLLLKRKIRPLLLAYLPEMILTLQVIHNCVHKGAVSTCYREMRKILENLSWVIVDDILLFRKRSYEEYCKRLDFIPPLRLPSKEWYEWSKEKRLILKSLSDLVKPLQTVVKKIKEKYGWNKKKIEKAIFNNMSYPLFLTLIGKNSQPPDKLKLFIPSYEIKQFKPIIEKNIEDIISQLKGKPLSNYDREFIRELSELIVEKENRSFITTIPYPSTSFIIQLLEKVS